VCYQKIGGGDRRRIGINVLFVSRCDGHWCELYGSVMIEIFMDRVPLQFNSIALLYMQLVKFLGISEFPNRHL
jgi:hypothetical protein